MARITYLQCTKCGDHLSATSPQTVCPKDGGALYARYDLHSIGKSFRPTSLLGRTPNMWRYAEVLPEAEPVSLGEGFTPLLSSREHANAYIKEEGLNPTGSFKARGLCAAVTMAKMYGLKKLAIPSAGNAASALAAYSAAARIEAHIFMPRDVPLAHRVECEIYGAQITLVNGGIGDCARMVADLAQKENWFDLSSMKEPFRLEGKKTMGYELVEQLGWRLPHAIVCPCGGGLGLVAMWKAFDEMEELGWIGSERPKMIAVQPSGCAPIVKAWEEKKPESEMWLDPSSSVTGLRVPKPYGDYLILEILHKSHGTALAVTDDEIAGAVQHWARVEGVFASPEGAASLAAYRKLREEGFFSTDDMVVLFNTGSGLKYLDAIGRSASKQRQPASRQIGGIIGPY